MSRKPPPRKRPGVPTGRRTLNGVIMDVTSVAAYRGETEKSVRAKVARKRVPFRKQGGRVIFIKCEIDEFHRRLPGVTLEEALRNATARNGAGEA